jgi:hypothetical protein
MNIFHVTYFEDYWESLVFSRRKNINDKEKVVTQGRKLMKLLGGKRT